jgi:uncharacterized protein
MRVLALNGGGTAGIASCLVLERIEQETGERIADLFDLVVGVSTGAIITGAVGTGMPAAQLVDLYTHDIPTIFTPRIWPLWNGYIGQAKYDHRLFESMLLDIFRGLQIGETKTDCMILGTQVSPRLAPFFWRSWMSSGEPALLRDIIRASSAAPMYFEPKVINNRTFVDGGIVANNPASPALIEALKTCGNLSDISMVNIQLGDAPTYTPEQAHRLRSILPSASMLIDMLLSANIEMSEYVAKNLLNEYINIDFNFTEPLDFWSTAFLNKARNMVDQLWAVQGNRIVKSLTIYKDVRNPTESTTRKLPVIINDLKNEGSHADQTDPDSDN